MHIVLKQASIQFFFVFRCPKWIFSDEDIYHYFLVKISFWSGDFEHIWIQLKKWFMTIDTNQFFLNLKTLLEFEFKIIENKECSHGRSRQIIIVYLGKTRNLFMQLFRTEKFQMFRKMFRNRFLCFSVTIVDIIHMVSMKYTYTIGFIMPTSKLLSACLTLFDDIYTLNASNSNGY